MVPMKPRRAPTQSARPLAGASVVVTRPAGTATALRRRVRALGGHFVALPGVGLRAVADADVARRALRAARTADVVVFVSPAAVRYAFALEPRLRFARATQVVAPGLGSARALHRRGIVGTVSPSRQDSEGVLGLPGLQRLRGRRVVLIGAAGGRELLPKELAARGARVERIEVYARTAPRLTARHLAALAAAPTPRISMFSSAEALANLRRCLPPEVWRALAGGECVASSARIAMLARTAGFVAVHVARAPQPAALVSAAVATLGRHRL